MKPIKIAALVLLLMATGCAKQAPAPVQERITPVEVSNIELTSIKKELVYAGKVSPSQTVSVSSKSPGKVAEVYFDVGQKVKAGDILFKLDEKDLRDQIRQLESQLNVSSQAVRTAENSLANITGGQYESTVIQSQTAIENSLKQMETTEIAVKNAEIALTNAKNALENKDTNFTKTKTLYKEGVISKSDYERAELDLKASQASVEQAENALENAILAREQAIYANKTANENLSLLTGKTIEDQKRSAGMAVSQAEASKGSIQTQIEIARANLSELEIKAPMDGVVSVKNAKAGEFTSSQLPAFTIVEVEKVNVEVKVSEALINNINVGDQIEIYIKSIADTPFLGKIVTISPAADQTSTFPVKLEIENSSGLIKPGMFCDVRFVKDFKDGTVVVPRNTVLEDETEKFVYINDNGVAKKVVVETGIDNGEQIELTTGITPGTSVVTRGQSYLSDGDKLNVISQGGK